jgi:hypothetical protein
MSTFTEHRIAALRNQIDFMELVQARHTRWASEAMDPEVVKIYTELAESFANILLQYDHLLQQLGSPVTSGRLRRSTG